MYFLRRRRVIAETTPTVVESRSRVVKALRGRPGETTNDNRRSTARSTRSPVEFKRKEEIPRVRVRSLEGASTPVTVATVGGATLGQRWG